MRWSVSLHRQRKLDEEREREREREREFLPPYLPPSTHTPRLPLCPSLRYPLPLLSPSHFRSYLQNSKAYVTRDSQAVSDPSTNRAHRCLTCQIGRDGVFSTSYERKREGCYFLGWSVKISWSNEWKFCVQMAVQLLFARQFPNRESENMGKDIWLHLDATAHGVMDSEARGSAISSFW